MSIRRKMLILCIVMLVVPVTLIMLLTILLLALIAAQNPDINLFVLEPVRQEAGMLRYLSGYFAIWAVASVVVTVVTALCVTAYLSRSILRPLRELNEAMTHMKEGDLNYEFVGSGDAEIKALCTSFEELRLHLQKSVSTDLLREREHKMLLANISHDLKTPITSIRGYVEGVRDGVADTPEKLSRYLDTVLAKTEVLEDMVENLSLYSKLELKRLPYRMQIEDMAAFLRQVMEEFALDLQRADMQVHSTLPPEPVMVKFDREKMHRVFANIIGNAIKYKKAGTGALTVQAERTGGKIAVSFTDSGIGIRADEVERVFEGFYRGDPSRNNQIEGNGLGLAITRQIVEDHGGKIWIRSEEGAGTEVVLLLPVAQQKEGDNAHAGIDY